MDKEHKVPKRVLINQPKIPQMPPKFSAQFVSPSPKGFCMFQKHFFFQINTDNESYDRMMEQIDSKSSQFLDKIQQNCP